MNGFVSRGVLLVMLAGVAGVAAQASDSAGNEPDQRAGSQRLTAAVLNTDLLSIDLLANGRGEYLEGAGCYYTATGHHLVFDDPSTWRYYFIRDIYGTGRAWVSIDGEVHVLDPLGASLDGDIEPGRRWLAEYGAGDVSAVLDVEVTGVGEGYWSERGTLTAASTDRQRVVAVVGECGS